MNEKARAIFKFYTIQLSLLAAFAIISFSIYSYAMNNFEKAEARQAEGFRAWAGENLRLPDDANFETKFPDNEYYANVRTDAEWEKGLLRFTSIESHQVKNKSLFIDMHLAPSGKAWSDVFAAAYATDGPNLTRLSKLAKEAASMIISEPNALQAIEAGNVTYFTYDYGQANRKPFFYALQAEPDSSKGLWRVTVTFNSADARSYLWRKIETESAETVEVQWAYRLDLMDSRHNGGDAWKEIDRYTRLIDKSPLTVFGRDFGRELRALFAVTYLLAFITSATAFLAVMLVYLRKRKSIPIRGYVILSAAFLISILLLKNAYALAFVSIVLRGV